jgi:Lrp/AsnC family transcriptional regulator of lysine biosynthesis
MKFDEKDRRIMDLLRENSRITNTELSKHVELTEGAVRSRIKRLVDSGTIRKFTIEASAEAQSYAVLMAKAQTETKKMMEEIIATNLHSDAYEISGEYDGCIILSGNSMDEIDKKIDLIRKIPSVSETRTFISFRRW